MISEMAKTCLVTGGAGFIGCALSTELPKHFDRVVAMDNMHPQVHANATRPGDLDERVELLVGDVTSGDDWDRILADVAPSTVIHLAAETGTGQSLTEASRHAEVNVVGTTQMLDAFTRNGKLPERIVLTSSRAVYGEGAWQDANGKIVYPGQRTRDMLDRAQWDFPGLTVLPFNSSTVVADPTSVYGSTKLAQEHIIRAWSLAMKVTPVIFRLQNVYGPGQSLTNPYTGILPFFAQKARSGDSIPVYEDGDIVRDFVYINDVASAIVSGALNSGGNKFAYDIGSGSGTTILQVAEIIASIYDAPRPTINGMFRDGDVRAASCTITDSQSALDWSPKVSVTDGVARLCHWIDTGERS
ncbi:NAD-dependent epimerase/dehydratase family protein [Antricoccus suffuscus]|nr:NAD-dependent epimerase/dehydratase family protein [Antricoccus suffuscus]